MFSSTSLFATLPARPPTPPRDVSKDVDDALHFLEDGHQDTSEKPATAVQSISETAIGTPPPISPSTSHQRDSGAKKVDFSPWPTYHKISNGGLLRAPINESPKQTPPSRETKPLKSILKPSNEISPLTPDDLESKLRFFSPQEPGSFGKMLQSVLHQLGSSTRSARLDAYLAINGAIKAYGNVPETAALVDKMAILMQFLSRDIAWKDTEGRLDSQIVSQAVQLTCTILSISQLSSSLDNDFRIFLLERSIAMMEQPNIPKAIVKSHMYLLTQQHFHSSVMTASRTDKILTAVQTIEDRCTGNNALSTRLVIYQRLIEQAPSTMLIRMRDWLKHVFHGMLSNHKDIRLRAMDTCTKAGIALGTHQHAAKVLYELFKTEVKEGQSYGDFLNTQLIQMIADKETSAHVSQIWAAVVLFFRCKQKPIAKWPQFHEWLLIIQRCLNSSDLTTKQQAHHAWNKLVFTVMPDGSTTQTVRSMLKVPIIAAIERRGNDKTIQKSHHFAMDSYYNLLHYALRPGLSNEELDLAWDMYVKPVLTTMSKSGSRGQHCACRIIHGVLSKNSGVWNVNAAIEGEVIKPEELPRLDSRWVRSRLDRFITLIEPMLHAWLSLSPGANASLKGTWRALLQLTSEAGSQEVRTSAELKEAIAQLVNIFRRIWFRSSEPAHADDSVWLERYHYLVRTTVESLGSGYLVEEILIRSKEDRIEAGYIPSHGVTKSDHISYSPFRILFTLHYHPPVALRSNKKIRQSAKWLIDLLSEAKSANSGRLHLLNGLLEVSAGSQTRTSSPEVEAMLWDAIAESVEDTLMVDDESPCQGTPIDSAALRSASNILISGLQFVPSQPQFLTMVGRLFTALSRASKHQSANEIIITAAMEPTVKAIIENLDIIGTEAAVRLSTSIFGEGVWPDEKLLEFGRKSIPPTEMIYKSLSHTYRFVNIIMTHAYHHIPEVHKASPHLLTDLLSSVIKFFRECPSTLLSGAIYECRNGLAVWVEDWAQTIHFASNETTSDMLCQTRDDITNTLADQVIAFWRDLLQLMSTVSSEGSYILHAIDQLVIAGFSTSSKQIFDKTVDFWNATFGTKTNLGYTRNLIPVLRARKDQAELLLPGFPDATDEKSVVYLPELTNTERHGLVPSRLPTDTTASKPEIAALFDIQLLMDNPSTTQFPLVENSVTDQTLDNVSQLATQPRPAAPALQDAASIRFAPIDPFSSSPLAPSDAGSVPASDHKERNRMELKADAQTFPELSSSPEHSENTPKETLNKKLNFSSDAVSGPADVPGTPTGLADNQPMSDDLPSSPTPRATPANFKADKDNGNNDCMDDTDWDPPSSPPRRGDDNDFAKRQTEDRFAQFRPKKSGEEADGVPSEMATESDLVQQDAEQYDLSSDASMQLQREEAAAEAEHLIKDNAQPTEFPSHRNRPATRSNKGNDSNRGDLQTSSPNAPNDVSTTEVSEPNNAKPQRLSRKRQYVSPVLYAANKRRRPSSQRKLGQIASDVSQAGDDSDDGDEIVVASRRTSSPLNLSEGLDEVSTPTELQSEFKPMSGPQKRGRGRPRKHKVSNLDHAMTASDVSSDDPNTCPESDIVEEKEANINTQELPKMKERSANLLITPNESPVDNLGQENAMEVDQEALAQSSGKSEREKVCTTQQVAQPKSVLDHLRGVLADCKEISLDAQEERLFDDILFELRREVHDAGRRGRGY